MGESWYRLDGSDVVAKFHSDELRGLDYGEARQRIADHGPNVLVSMRKIPCWLLFARQFKDFMVLVLLAATAISFFLGEKVDALTILIIVLMNAVLGYIQESRAEQSLEALQRMSAPEAKVVREGRVERFAAHDLVPGDIVLLEAGDIVPADLRLLEVASMETMEAALTGESMPVRKKKESMDKPVSSLGDIQNMAYMGTVVVRGRGKGIVVDTGMKTEMGRIASMIQSARAEETPLQHRLAQLGKWLVGICLFICVLVVGVGLWRGEPLYSMFLTGVSLAVAAIPEGLPAVVTIALALGVQRMARRSAIIRRLPAVETLGCATVICSDKTGTLTQNKMSVQAGIVGGSPFKITEEGMESVARAEDLKLFLRIAVLCNNSILEYTKLPASKLFRRITGHSGEQWQVKGDPTEGALSVLAGQSGFRREEMEKKEKRVAELPFDADKKSMTVVCRSDGKLSVYTKGAPDILLSRCSHYLKDGRVLPLNSDMRGWILKQNGLLAERAMRVLALAYKELKGVQESAEEYWERDLVFVGLAGMIDPPRPQVYDAVQLCRRAGIRVVMITGDHQLTARAVARELNIPANSDNVLTGYELDKLGDQELEQALRKTSVFARVSPRHKLRIVQALKRCGHVVAMTGDGVNDAPAVKEADIGIAMGKSGTDVTREASAMVLADDDFSTIVSAIEEGRAIYANIRKFVRYLLTCNTGEILVMLLAVLVGLPLPLLPIQILWVNLVTDGLPAMALGIDPPDPGIMTQTPRPAHESIFARGMGWRILRGGLAIGLGTLTVFTAALMFSLSLAVARTMAFNTLVFFQLFYVFNCRSESLSPLETGFLSNPQLLGAIAFSFFLQAAVNFIQPLAHVFHVVQLQPEQLGLVLGIAALPLATGIISRAWQNYWVHRVTYMRF